MNYSNILMQNPVVQSAQQAEYRWHSPWLAQYPCRHLPESVFAGIAVFVRWLLNAPVSATTVDFTHAFRDWFGQTPSAWRNQQT
jgi:hypothetical protein